MIKVGLRIHPVFLSSQVRLIEELAEALKRELPVPYSSPEPDPDLEEAWRSSLVQEVEQDLNCLLIFLGKEGLGTRSVSLNEGEADAVLRACSAVRLKIRETFLSAISGEDMERGLVDMERLSPRERGPFACYLFLAALQDHLLSQMKA